MPNIVALPKPLSDPQKPKRAGITKKTRFEVFKRDSFSCQYCGAKAPDVILHVDHVNPVSKGGDNDLLNLITACFSCNSGKRDSLIDDKSTIHKQRAQLEELNERRKQLKMILKWKEDLKKLNEQEIEGIAAAWQSRLGGYYLNDHGRASAAKLIRRFGITAVLEAIDIATEAYLQRGDDGQYTRESVEHAWHKVKGICVIKSSPPGEQRLYYIRGILRNRFSYMNEPLALTYMRNALRSGVDLEDLSAMAREAKNWSQWSEWVNEAMDAKNG